MRKAGGVRARRVSSQEAGARSGMVVSLFLILPPLLLTPYSFERRNYEAGNA